MVKSRFTSISFLPKSKIIINYKYTTKTKRLQIYIRNTSTKSDNNIDTKRLQIYIYTNVFMISVKIKPKINQLHANVKRVFSALRPSLAA